MNFKSTLFPFFIFCCIHVGLAQNRDSDVDTSHTVHFDPDEMQKVYTASFRLEAGQIDIVPIRIHILANQLGQKADSAVVMSSLAKANLEFEKIGIKFQLCARIEYVLNDRLYALDSYAEESEMLSNYNDPGTLDIFYVGAINHKSACGYATLGWNWDGFVVMLCNNDKVLIHELGHYFNLLHTHDDLYEKELVNGSNCLTGGDRVCDTKADPNVYGLVDFNCQYIGTAKDANGAFYTPPVDNHMSYSNQDCRIKFTDQQRTRMRYYYDNVGKQLFNCSTKPDFAASFLPSSSKLSKLTSNTISFEIRNNSVNTYTGALEYTLLLKPLQGNVITLYNGIINGTYGRFWEDTIVVQTSLNAQILAGTYVLTLQIDPLNKVGESNEENNTQERQVSVYSTEIPLPDLVSLITGNANHESGTSFRVNASHTNLGNVISGTTTTSIYLSADSILDGSDTQLSNYSLGQLPVGETYRYVQDISLPKDLDKVYYAILVADASSEVEEISEVNNYYAFAIRNLSPQDNTTKPDLKVTAHKWEYSVPTSLKVLDKPYLSFTVTSSGVATDYPFFTGLYISKDDKLSSDDLFMYSTTNSYAQFTVPLEVKTGSYYIIIKADYNDYIYESNELNNTYAIPMNFVNEPTPDIAIDSYSLSSYVWEFNKNYQVNIGIINKGTGVSDSWYFTLHLQKEKYFYASKTFRYAIREFYNSAYRYNTVLPGATYVEHHTISVTQDKFAEGYYYMAICANNTGFRDWEVNNCTVVDKPILFVDKLLAQLEIEDEKVAFMELYPNPASDLVTVVSNRAVKWIRLLSPTGQEHVFSSNHTINVSDMSAGVYMAHIQLEDGSTHTKKLIIVAK